MQIQHVKIKVPLEAPEAPDFEAVIRCFHGWIRDQTGDEVLIDVADYRHVPNGPEVLLIARDGDYGFDREKGRRGFFYVRKAPVPGGGAAALEQALRSVLTGCRRLEADASFAFAFAFSRRALEVSINDRALAPNDAATFSELAGELRAALSRRLGDGGVTLRHASAGEPRELLRVWVELARPYDPERVIAALS